MFLFLAFRQRTSVDLATGFTIVNDMDRSMFPGGGMRYHQSDLSHEYKNLINLLYFLQKIIIYY